MRMNQKNTDQTNPGGARFMRMWAKAYPAPVPTRGP